MKSLIGNKVAEKDIREWLSQNGFFGRSARFKELELHAIQRPGWLQVFRFTVEAKTQTGGWTTFFGAVRDDERSNETTIKTFAKFSDQQRLLADWSANLIRRQSNRSDEVLSMPWVFLSVGGFIAGLILLLYLTSLVY